MLSVTCKCGASFRVPEKMAGRRVKCKHCGGPIPIPAADTAPKVDKPLDSGESPFFAEAAAAADGAADKLRTQSAAESLYDLAPDGSADSAVPHGTMHVVDECDVADGRSAYGGYWKDCLASFFFISDPGNLITFLFLAAIGVVQVLLPMSFCFGIAGALIIGGWIAAFMLNTVLNAANGERDLPDLSLTEGWVDGIIVPFFQFVATWLFVQAPAILYMIFVADMAGMADDGDPILAILIWSGVFFWPMSVLVIGLGGVTTFARFDLMLKTLFRTFVPYCMTCILTGAALAIFWFSNEAVIRGNASNHPLALQMVVQVSMLYASVVAMRVIGLYYHHFKDRFAWDWG